ncbi:hypothetical protein GCM10010448_40410 [Streptomyces glomeratus]|uniref:Uncharacterized protein n=1 Tax=Streptomyces glomeratus TaxID=284452 RepID=A0ABP6LR98_9ACTN
MLTGGEEAGDAASVADAYGDLLDDVVRVLGPDHLYISIASQSLTYWYERAGEASGTVGWHQPAGKLSADCRFDRVVRSPPPEHLRIEGSESTASISRTYGSCAASGEDL